jgi:hypothetical protein
MSFFTVATGLLGVHKRNEAAPTSVAAEKTPAQPCALKTSEAKTVPARAPQGPLVEICTIKNIPLEELFPFEGDRRGIRPNFTFSRIVREIQPRS